MHYMLTLTFQVAEYSLQATADFSLKGLIAKRSERSVAHLPKIKYCSSFYRSESACKRGFSQ